MNFWRIIIPYPAEHAARLKSPGIFDPKSFRRTAGGTIFGKIKVPASIGIIWGKAKGRAAPADPPMPQALRFDKTKFTVQQAKAWLKDKGIDDLVKLFEPASDKD